MLRLTNVTIARGIRVLYSKATALASDGDRVALIGENGCGKSSLFAAILGELPVEDGQLETPPRDRIACVAQSIDAVDTGALDFVVEAHMPLAQAKKRLSELSGSGTLEEAEAIAHLAELNEGAVRAEAQSIMAGLGFSNEDGQRPVRSFSGGWRNRLALARALLSPSDLLLLDEPTNHLDLDSLIWLEAWLKKLRSTVVIISHDREFLDRTTTATWAIENLQLTRYGGNYSFYEQARIEKIRQQDAAAKAYEREAQHLTSYIERFRYKATKARQAQSRIKMLDRLVAIEPFRARREWRFEFLKPERTPEHLVDLERVDLGYGTTRILQNVNLSIRSGERIGVLGVNGAGKSTLIKAISGALPCQRGELREGQGLSVGYFAQHQLEMLDGNSTPIDTMKHLAPEVREQELRDWLGKFRFSGELSDARVATLSGGEKARLALATITWTKPNLLVLDEPTNHLDMATREALTMALSTFEGTLLLVSHDRHLLRSACEKLLLVHAGNVTEYDGDLDDYAQLVLEHRKAVREAQKAADRTSEPRQSGTNRKEERRQEAQERARIAALRKPLQSKLSNIERKMAPVSEKLKELDAKIADSDWYQSTPQDAVAAVLLERAETASALEELEMQWLEISEQIESIGA